MPFLIHVLIFFCPPYRLRLIEKGSYNNSSSAQFLNVLNVLNNKRYLKCLLAPVMKRDRYGKFSMCMDRQWSCFPDHLSEYMILQ